MKSSEFYNVHRLRAFSRFDEESRENSSEMKPTSKSNTMTKISEETGNTENSESPENQEKLKTSRLETDRPRVSSDEWFCLILFNNLGIS